MVNLYYVMDDRVLVCSDVRKVTDTSFMGYSTTEDFLQKDYDHNMEYLKQKRGNIVICDVKQKEVLSGEKLEEMRRADGVVVTVAYGKIHGTYLAYVIEQLHTQDCHICGVAVRDADEKFLRSYYGRMIVRA